MGSAQICPKMIWTHKNDKTNQPGTHLGHLSIGRDYLVLHSCSTEFAVPCFAYAEPASRKRRLMTEKVHSNLFNLIIRKAALSTDWDKNGSVKCHKLVSYHKKPRNSFLVAFLFNIIINHMSLNHFDSDLKNRRTKSLKFLPNHSLIWGHCGGLLYGNSKLIGVACFQLSLFRFWGTYQSHSVYLVESK